MDASGLPGAIPFFQGPILRVPTGAIVVLVGPHGAGKTTWARRHFNDEQILSVETFHTLVAGSDTEVDVSVEAFDLLLSALASRARRQITTVLDGLFLDPVQRRRVLEVARAHDRPALAVGFLIGTEIARARAALAGRLPGLRTLRRQMELVDQFVAGSAAEGWHRVAIFGDDEADALPSVRLTLPPALPWPGPFDVIGDIHGCREELDLLLDRLGWGPPDSAEVRRHPAGRVAVFVGDFADRGPDSAGVFRRAMAMVQAGTALAVPGNHCLKLRRHLEGKPVEVSHGLELTLAQLEAEGAAFQRDVRGFLESLPRMLVLAERKLVVFHAALPLDRVGRADQATLHHTAFGIVRGTDEHGFPIRDIRWTETWKAGAEEPFAVYGHSPVPAPLASYNTLNIDGGCVFGGYLAAYRFPERVLVAVPAGRVYWESPKVTWRGVPAGVA